MPAVQTAFARTQDSYFEGQITDSRYESNSKVVENSGGIAFGKPIFQGTNDNGCVKAQTLAAAGSASAGNVGTSTITASPTAGAGAKIGRYVITQLTTAGTGALQVSDPDGEIVAHGNVGTAITTIPGITSVTVTAAGTPTAGDTFYIDVTGNGFLGISIRDKSRPPSNGDLIPRYSPCGYLEGGSIAVRTSGAVAKDAQAYWDPVADRFTSTGGNGKIKLPGWKFDGTIGAAGLVPVRRI